MNKAIKNSLQAVGWMIAGAVLLVIGWFAFAQFVLLPRFESGQIPEFQKPTVVEASDARLPDTRPNYRRRGYNRSTMSHVYARGAAPARPQDHVVARGGWTLGDSRSSLEHAVTGHRVVPGSGAMLNYQRYSGDVDPPAITDRAEFEKLTVFFPGDPPGDYGYLPLFENPNIILFWSRGSPDLDKGQICAGYAKSGVIEYRRVSGKFEAKLAFEIDASGSAQPDGSACEPFEFRHSSEFWTRDAADLEQWNGGDWGRVSIMDCMPDR